MSRPVRVAAIDVVAASAAEPSVVTLAQTPRPKVVGEDLVIPNLNRPAFGTAYPDTAYPDTASSGVSSFDEGAKFFTLASLRWMWRHKAITPWYLARYWRFFRFKLANPSVVTTGMIFMDKGASITVRTGYARLKLGRWIHIGANTAIRAHEGTLRIGDKCIFGRGDSLNCYLDLDIGAHVLVADDVYISDFDHKFTDLTVPIKDQGISKSRVRIGDDVWLATKVTVASGVVVGSGSVVGANSVVTRDLPPYSVAVGAPARVIRDRRHR